MNSSGLLQSLIDRNLQASSDAIAVVSGDTTLTYAQLAQRITAYASTLKEASIGKGDRVALYDTKSVNFVAVCFAAAEIGAIFVPINPILKPPQVQHILQDSGATLIATSAARAKLMANAEISLPTLLLLEDDVESAHDEVITETPLLSDPVAILYTSGSTGKPKGVVLSHQNMVLGAESVASYLEISTKDRILGALPLSFDAGFSQVTTAFASGASVYLLDYLLPKAVADACSKHQITAITGVPPLWLQLLKVSWADETAARIRYFANTGGRMPRATLDNLRKLFPKASPYLMYGLTEAFRSTYLPPQQVDNRPDSIGKAIPNARVRVINSDHHDCEPNEPGELVHEGPLVSLGYWRDQTRTDIRFKPAPGAQVSAPLSPRAVWSGDIVRKDEEGYLFYVGRNDEMIKTSGYRVSPTEVEEMAYASSAVSECVALGVSDDELGEAIWLIAIATGDKDDCTQKLTAHFRSQAPSYMQLSRQIWTDQLPRNPNGKLDRVAIRNTYVEVGNE